MCTFKGKYSKEKIFNAGLYLRVSREDEKDSKSESIINQKELLTKYVQKNGWNLVDCYIDDGYSGTNFERPGFKNLKKDIQIERINMVITKDLSRLGRDYIETGYYIERFFPENNIRYIALNDGLDTFDLNNNNNEMSPFKSVINDMYARDISKKVRAAINSKKENGKFIGAFAPYGYRKNSIDKNKLVIDNITAPVVNRIFKMYLKGAGYSKIANYLNNEGIISPSIYKANNSNYRNKQSTGLWTHETVKKILSNPTYAGHITQNKYYKLSYKIKKLKNIPKDSWITVLNTHDAIIDQFTFDSVQDMMNRKTNTNKPGKNKKHLLSGLVFCGDCGERMTYTTTPKGIDYSICSKYKRFNLCSRHSFEEEKLNNCVLSELRSIAKKAIDKERLIKVIKIYSHSKVDNSLEKEITNIENRLGEIKRLLKRLFEDKVKYLVTEQDFIDFSNEYNNERNQLNKRLKKIKIEKNQYRTEIERQRYNDLLTEFIEFKNPCKSMLVQFIEKIEIFEGMELKIYFKILNPF